MKVQKLMGLLVTGLLFNMVILADANAESIRLRCEVRKNPARAKISVDGRGFAVGQYRAKVTSGGKTKITKLPAQSPVGGEVEFDFDSNRADVREGATFIQPTFIKDKRITATIIDQDGFAVAPQAKACRAR